MAAATLSSATDFRSDTVTLPTDAMLASISEAANELGDDVFFEDGPTNSLQRYVAELTGMPYALFVLSGTMGNQLALRSLLTQPPYSVLCDRRSHINEWECGMTSIFSQAHLIPVASTQEDVAYLTLDDIIPNIVPDDGDQHTAPTRVIAIENTFMGRIIPVDEVKRISQYARERKIKVHLDGARLWNACYPPETLTKSPEEASMAAKQLLRAYCSNVDTVTLCFSKSLGAPGGSILLSHSQDIITRARHFRKALGGGVRQMGFLSAPALVALNEHFLDGATLRRDNERAKLLEEFWTQDLGGQTLWGLGQETNMVWLDLRSANVSGEEFVKIAKEEEREWEGGIIKVADGRVVLHHQISPSALEALKRVLRRTIEFGKLRIQAPPGVERRRRVDRTSRREGGGVGGRENGAEGRGRGGGGKEGERGEGEREKGEENEDEKAEKAEEFESLKKAVEKERQRREDRYDDLGF